MITSMPQADYLRRLRADAVKRGLCYVCRCRAPRPGLKCCDECIARSGGRKTNLRRKRRCLDCGRARDSKRMRCARCLKLRQAQSRRWRVKARGAR